MPSDLRTLHITAVTPQHLDERVRPITANDSADLAVAYLHAYPPEVGAPHLNAADAEIADTFAGVYGELVPSACLGAELDGHVVGAVFTTTRSLWDEIDGPFIIDLFVHPDHRGRGLARALVEAAIQACAKLGADAVSLRVGEGTSPAAHALYAHLGFVEPEV
ncbi:MAG: GNAT family N-acetyltransferase [Tessaracoccus sp.]|uniref:GNAT family N-acetyltransferase n=1 Tax=Tessaracoccus sp. TaxID=1971211 RepID=UPI001ED6B25C|nr:GNAT family N-acetyltransferase [Tessaracoccus sp.]MBK7821134.1 GNAT family N-acetyltransferase [Tessaracoccus sp.]